MEIRITWKYVAAFLFLTILCGTSHEFVHHFTGAAICGEFGYKTFNSFALAENCQAAHPNYFWATVAGPAFTFALMWFGLYQLRKPDATSKQLGFALIFANFPINRIFFALINSNDEQWVSRLLFGKAAWAFWATNLLIWLCAIPPLVVAYRAIENKRRFLWFAGFFILPFVFVVAFAGIFLENFLLLEHKILAGTIFGVPYLIMLVEIICLAGYGLTKKYLYAAADGDLTQTEKSGATKNLVAQS